MSTMAYSVVSDPLILRAILKAANTFADSQASGLGPSRVPKVLAPFAVQILYTAVQRAWEMIVVLQPSTAERRSEVIEALAVGVLGAAAEGDLDVGRLSRAACWRYIEHWAPGGAPPPSAILQ
jgi:hypothetical protein